LKRLFSSEKIIYNELSKFRKILDYYFVCTFYVIIIIIYSNLPAQDNALLKIYYVAQKSVFRIPKYELSSNNMITTLPDPSVSLRPEIIFIPREWVC